MCYARMCKYRKVNVKVNVEIGEVCVVAHAFKIWMQFNYVHKFSIKTTTNNGSKWYEK